MKEEGLLNISHMKSGTWYKVLLENKVTMQSEANGTRTLKPCKVEIRNPEVDWNSTWALANMKGLNPTEKTFLWRMIHNILPTPARLFHMKIKNTPHPNCLLCDLSVPGDLTHSLLTCPFNMEVYTWLMRILQTSIPPLQPQPVMAERAFSNRYDNR